ncbi:hypothetical protein GW17_00059872, partial [Ensete ventricosum]
IAAPSSTTVATLKPLSVAPTTSTTLLFTISPAATLVAVIATFFLPCHYHYPIVSFSLVATQSHLLPLPLPSPSPSLETLLLPSIAVTCSCFLHCLQPLPLTCALPSIVGSLPLPRSYSTAVAKMLALLPFFFPLPRSCFCHNHHCQSRQLCYPSSSLYRGYASVATAAANHASVAALLPLPDTTIAAATLPYLPL